MKVAKVAQQIGLIPKCGTNCTLSCCLARVRVEPAKIVLQIGQILARARTETVKMVRGYIPRTLKRIQFGDKLGKA